MQTTTREPTTLFLPFFGGMRVPLLLANPHGGGDHGALAPFRLLTDDMPHQPYASGQGRGGARKHFGQMKLFLSEVEFLAHFAARGDIMVYAGAADGLHFPLLHSLFPCISEWYLYDPHRFHPGVHALADRDRNIHINWHGRGKHALEHCFFGDEDASALLEYAAREKKQILFVSDIRREASDDHKIVEDMDMQRKWTALLQCKYFMLKFWPPYPSLGFPSAIPYLCCDVVLQVYALINSTECRLISGDCHSSCSYDIAKHGEQMAYFNNVEREHDGYDARAAVHIMEFYQKSWHNNEHRRASLPAMLSAARGIFPAHKADGEWRKWCAQQPELLGLVALGDRARRKNFVADFMEEGVITDDMVRCIRAFTGDFHVGAERYARLSADVKQKYDSWLETDCRHEDDANDESRWLDARNEVARAWYLALQECVEYTWRLQRDAAGALSAEQAGLVQRVIEGYQEVALV